MRATDIFIELVRLAEQAGQVTYATMHEDKSCWIDVKTKDGNTATFSMSFKEAKKDGN